MGRPGQYLFRPDNSTVWHVRFQYPESLTGEKSRKVVYSLRTRDKDKANIKKLRYIEAHLKYLAEIRERRSEAEPERRPVVGLVRRFLVGRHDLPGDICGVVSHDNPDQIEMTDRSGRRWYESAIEEIPIPGEDRSRVEYEADLEAGSLLVAHPETGEILDADCPGWRGMPPVTLRAPPKPDRREDPDVAILKKWIETEGVTEHIQREAWRTFELFKEITGGKRFAESGFDEGVALATRLFDEKHAYATVRKNVGHLRAAINVAIKRRAFVAANPFSGVVRKQKIGDVEERLPFDDDDMALVRRLGPKFFKQDEWLLWVLMATTGMRLEEAVTISSERAEKGIRYVVVGTKTLNSLRRVPLPDAVCALIPNKITEPLFPKSEPTQTAERQAAMYSQRMNRRLRAMGIKDKAKVLYSLRHRAKDRLRAEGVPLDLQYELLGHEKKTVAAGYGVGAPLMVGKPCIEKIGY